MSSDLEAPSSTTPHASRLAVLLFTDLVGSTGLKSRFGTVAFARLLARHDAIFKQLIAPVPMAEILQDTGDGYFASFATTADALQFALQFQSALRQERWDPADAALRARIGIHMGEIALIPPSETGGKTKVVGMAADVAARVMSLGMGGQVLLTRVAFDEARQFVREHPVVPSMGDTSAPLPPLKWMAHGEYLFKGTSDPIDVFEVGGEGIAPLTPPPDTDKARRSVSAIQEETLGWRPAVGLEVPQRVGWTLTRKLGEGTFGEVWLARSETTKQTRVFKFCFDAERLRSFKREVTFFRLLRDVLGERDDIAQLYDVRLNEPPFFLESEFASGGNLLDWATSKGGIEKVPLETRIDLVARVADAVAAAHSVGILHKDIKPSNILVHEQNGTPMPQLADFGIGLLTDKSQLQSHHITEAGFTLLEGNESSRTGTRMYAPPESLAHRPFTIQGDIYALGVLLYQMVVGDLNRPLAEGWERDLEDEFLREDVAACVDGDPAKRLSSATELARRLRGLSARAAKRETDRRAAETAARRKHLFRALAVFAAACLLIAIVSIVGYFRERALHRALADREDQLEKSEHTALTRQLESLMTAGDSLCQSQRYSEATWTYTQAWDLAESLKEPTIGALSGLLQARGSSAPSIIGRFPTSRPDESPAPVARVRAAPSGDLIVAGDGGGHAFVMDLTRSRVVARLPLKGWGYGIAFGEGGKACLVGSYDGELQAWDVGQWAHPRGAVQTNARIYGMASSPDGRTVACAGAEGSISFWDVATLKQIRRWDSQPGVLGVAFSPDGKLLAAGGKDGKLEVWDIAQGKVIQPFIGHTAEVVAVAFTPNEKKLLSGSYDKTVRVWEVASGTEVQRFAEHRGVVHDLAVSRDGRLAFSAGGDETVMGWEIETGRPTMRFTRYIKGALSVDLTPDGSAIVTSGENGVIAIRTLSGNDTPAYKLHDGRVADLCVLPDGLTALSGGWDRSVKQFDVATGRILRAVATPQAVSAIALGKDGRTALIGGGKAMLELLDLDSFTLAKVDRAKFGRVAPTSEPATTTAAASGQTPVYTSSIGVVAISPSGTQALVGGVEEMFSIFPLVGDASGRTWRAGGRVLAACFLPDGKHALVAVERDVYRVDVETGQRERIRTPTKPILAVAASPTENVAATGSYDETVRLWDVERPLNTKICQGHLGWVRAVAFLPDGKTLASASEDETVRLWDKETGKEIRCFTGHTGGVGALAISPDGQVILSGGADATVRKWDLSRPVKYRAMAEPLASLYYALDADPDNPKLLKSLGEWYAFRGRDDWAVQCLERARAGGESVSALVMARCYWNLNRPAEAAREFRLAMERHEAPASYLALCVAAVERRFN